MLLATVSTVFTNNLSLFNGHNYPPPMVLHTYNLQIAIANNTNNVDGGDSCNFGTWFYFDFSLDGSAYNDDNFKIITTEADWNAGGGGGSAGRRGDKDVFFIPCNTKGTIFSINSHSSNFHVFFTFGTFCWKPIIGWPHYELIYFTHTFQDSDYSKKWDDFYSTEILITASGVANNNSARADIVKNNI